jgi:hypothetical protein
MIAEQRVNVLGFSIDCRLFSGASGSAKAQTFPADSELGLKLVKPRPALAQILKAPFPPKKNNSNFSLKFFYKASVVIFMNITMVNFVSKTEMQSVTFFAEREFICWQIDQYVSLKLDIMPFRFTDAVAEDIARCLYDAVLITVGNQTGFVPTPADRDSILKRSYRERISEEWSYCADGRFNCHETEDGVYVVELAAGESEKTERVGVYTVEDGGVELVFEFMCYSFSMLDAVWLANALMEAMGREPLDHLETMSGL